MSTDIPTPNPRPAAIGKILATLPEPTPVPPMFPPLPGGVLTTGTRGAVSELIACAHLMRQGYHVFRCESPAAPFDLVAYKDGRAVRVEVKTMQGYRNDRGCPDFSPVRNLEWDLLIVVGDFEVVELPNDGDLALTRERFRAHFGWPPGQTRTRSGNRAESSAATSAVPTEGSGHHRLAEYAHPVAEGRCESCGDPVVYNLAVDYVAHKDADESMTCTKPWPAIPPRLSLDTPEGDTAPDRPAWMAMGDGWTLRPRTEGEIPMPTAAVAVAYRQGLAAGRTAAAAAIRRETATFCMDGVGRHLVDACARIAEGADQ